MSIGPIIPGRFPNSLSASRLQQNLQANSYALARLQDQIASGKRIFFPSDDPAAATRSLVLQKTLERKEQMQENIQTDRSLLSASESARSSVR